MIFSALPLYLYMGVHALPRKLDKRIYRPNSYINFSWL